MFHAVNQSPHSTPPVVEQRRESLKKKNTMVWRRIAVAAVFVSLTILFVHSDYPQVYARVERFFRQGNQLHNLGRMISSLIFDNPKEFKPVFDLVWHALAEFTADDETVRQARRRAKLHVAIYEDFKFSTEGNATKAEDVIKSIRFSSYEENNLCNLKEGIPEVEFDETVEEIADLTNMPIKLKRVVQRARNFSGGDDLAVNNLKFKGKNGSMVIGRIAILRNGDTIDMAYSLHSVTFDLKDKQSKSGNAMNFLMFFKTLNKANEEEYDEGDKDGADDISFDLQQDLLAFFDKKAIDGFVKRCGHLLKRLDNEKIGRAHV